MLKQRCRDSGEEKEKRARGRHGTAFVNFDDIMTDIAKNISVNCSTQPSNETKTAEPNKAGSIDPKQFALNSETFALNSETFAKAGEVLSNLAQHFVSVMDPFAAHEFIPPTQPNGNSSNTPTGSGSQNEPNQTKDSQVVIDDNQTNVPRTDAAPTPPQSNTPIVPVETVPVNSPIDLVTIEDDVEIPTAPRQSSPTPDWAMVDEFGYVDDASQSKNTGAIPKTSTTSNPSSVASIDTGAHALPNYAVLARDLEDHLHHTLISQSSQTPPQMPIAYHTSK